MKVPNDIAACEEFPAVGVPFLVEIRGRRKIAGKCTMGPLI